MEGTIDFLTEDISYEFVDPDLVREWIHQIILKHKHELQHLSVILCSDEYLRKINREELDHDYYTDIITFPLSPENSNQIAGDLFISLDRINENAAQRGLHPIDELHRVIIHGVLHLIGFDDKDEESKARMRKEEDLALNLRMF